MRLFNNNNQITSQYGVPIATRFECSKKASILYRLGEHFDENPCLYKEGASLIAIGAVVAGILYGLRNSEPNMWDEIDRDAVAIQLQLDEKPTSEYKYVESVGKRMPVLREDIETAELEDLFQTE